jgi:hypothetical protein
MGDSVNGETAGATNALTAIVIKGDRLDVLFNQPLVNDVQHLQKRSVRGDIVCRVLLETSAFLRPVLAKHVK